MSVKNKIIAFLIFCFVSALFFACSDDFIIGTSVKNTEKVEINDELESVATLEIKTRLRDSVFTGSIGQWSSYNKEMIEKGKEDKIYFPQFQRPDLLKDSTENPDYLKNTEEYLKEFFLSWSEVSGASGYDIRVYPEPVTEENWHLAEKVIIKTQSENDGKFDAVATLTPTPKIYTSNCVNCGECKKACPTGAISYQNSKAVIDYSKCIECGECFRSCDYNAIGGVFSGSDYYFAIRAYDNDSAFSKEITCTESRYKVRYTTLASIPDSLMVQDFVSGEAVKMGNGCAGNCTDGVQKGTREGTCGQCYIIQENACPVNAVYQVDSSNVEKVNTTAGAMFIDPEKCINCGECAIACYGIGPWGAVVTEVIKVD